MLEWKARILTVLVTLLAVLDQYVDAANNWNW